MTLLIQVIRYTNNLIYSVNQTPCNDQNYIISLKYKKKSHSTFSVIQNQQCLIFSDKHVNNHILGKK